MPFRLAPRLAAPLAAILVSLSAQAQSGDNTVVSPSGPSATVSAPDSTKDDVHQQLAALREAVIQQTRQIDLLTAEVARMSRVIGYKKTSAEPVVSVPAAPVPTMSAPGASAVPVAQPVTPVVAATPAVPTGPEYTVEKGDKLAVIAKKYNTTVDELEKLNHITDPKKIQIGQIIKLPPNTVTPTPNP